MWLVGAANPAHERRIHIVALEALDADARRIVIAERADVLRLPPEARAADRGARALSSRQRRQALDARLATRHRVVRDDRDDVEAVEAEGDDVERTVGRKGRQQRQAHQLTFAFPLSIVRAMLPLTKRQREILDYLNEFIQQHGYAPSLEEIGRRFGLSSLATVHKHLTNLQEKGLHQARVEPQPLGRDGADPDRRPRRSSCRCSATSPPASPIEAVVGNETIAVPEDLVGKRDTYVLRVRGDSMIDEQIRDGDFVIVEDRQTADNGEMVIALLGGSDVTLKKFYREQGRIRLQPANPADAADHRRPRQSAGAGRRRRRDAKY